jgi:hypothetical protein
VGVSAAVHAENQASAPGAGVEEFPRPELVTEMAPPAVTLDDHPLLPRRKRVARQSDARREPAGLPGPADASVPEPSAVEASAAEDSAVEASAADDGSGQTKFTARPDLNVLTQVLQGLRRMA